MIAQIYDKIITMYTRNVNAQIFLALLKKYNIKKIVISPGAQNFGIGSSVLYDDWFEAYSVVDERSAAYFATGLAFESNEPVVLSCTGATASRNYLPGLTEAFYRKLPIIALTGTHYHPDKKDLSPQSIDRSVLQNDIKLFSAELPIVKNDADFTLVEKRVNEALILSTIKNRGPVHLDFINSEHLADIKELPNVKKVDYYNSIDKKLSLDFSSKRIGILIGSHAPFSKETLSHINSFVKKAKAVVFCDHTSNYTGINKVLISQAFCKPAITLPDILIDIGSVTGDYNAQNLSSCEEVWRVSEDGVFHDRYNKMTKLFDMKESTFFHAIDEVSNAKKASDYYGEVYKNISEKDKKELGDLPMSATLTLQNFCKSIPKNSYLHLGILNSLRNADLFSLDDSIIVSSNVGGFGIDGPLSTIIGQSMVNPDKLHFCVLGDLAFFYDMNALGIRHIKNNLRILLINNSCGAEFHISTLLKDQVGEKINEYTAAGGHNTSAKMWAESMNFDYISANSTEELHEKMPLFCTKKQSQKPILFEVFTKAEDEEKSLRIAKREN